jgi:uncharacterized protein (UPF0332 family)
MLNDKARSNYIVAKWAEENRHFDAAVSRYYYCIYDSILFYCITNNLNNVIDNSSHIQTLKNVINYFQSSITPKEMFILSKIKHLREERKKSDYDNNTLLTNTMEFSNSFKIYFDKVYLLLKEKGVVNE